MDCKQETPFRIGGHYRQKNGVVAEVTEYSTKDSAIVSTVWAPEGMSLHGGGGRRWSDGKYTGWRSKSDDKYTLIPGELTQTPSGWVALGAEKKGNRLLTQEELRESIQRDFERAALSPKGPWIIQSEQRKVDPSPADVAMIDRDDRPQGTVPGRTEFNPFKGFHVGSNHIWQVGEERADHASPFGIFRNPDCDSGPSDHLNASRHQMAGMKG